MADPKTFSALVRSLERAGLLPLMLDPVAVVDGVLDGGQWHRQWGCGSRDAKVQGVAFADLVGPQRARVCEKCLTQVYGYGDGRGEAAIWVRSVLQLLEAHQVAASAVRLAARGSVQRGKTVKVRRDLGNQEDTVRAVASAFPSWGEHTDRVLATIDAGRDALLRAATSPAARKAALAAVHQLLLGSFRRTGMERVLDDTDTLVGIWPHHGSTQAVQEVLDSFTVHQDGRKLVLRGPSYLTDYVNRAYSMDPNAYPLILSAPAAGVDAETVQVAAAAWSPQNDTPTASLAVALTAARAAMH